MWRKFIFIVNNASSRQPRKQGDGIAYIALITGLEIFRTSFKNYEK